MALSEVQQWVWNEKYRLKRSDGTIVDRDINDTWRRVADALAEVETSDKAKWADKFHDVMASMEFLPAGRIIAGAGSGRDVTLNNCYVMGQIEDSLAGIMDAVKEAALTLKTGGGVGMDFSTLRPRGAPVAGVESTSSGAVSFMDLWHTMCGTIMSAGSRRGAMMGCLSVSHPDIEEFITAKQTKGRLTNFNVSVSVSNDFMEAVKDDEPWPLEFGGKVYKTLRARELWDRITALTYDAAEPGVLFMSRMNEVNPLRSKETLHGTNPCGEQPLPAYGACCLGSVNLTKFVTAPFTAKPVFDGIRLIKAVSLGVRMLDNVVSVSKYPLLQQAEEANNKRRIGLGITGLGDALIMLGLRYGSPAAVKWTAEMMAFIRTASEQETERLGRDRGSFPLFDDATFGWYGEPKKHRRNSHVLSIAPTGTISLLAGNISGGIEPVFAWSASRKLLQPDGTHKSVVVHDYARGLHKGNFTGSEWVTAQELTPKEHIDMMSACQPHVDSAISKTVNCPESMTLDEFRSVYDYAWDQGLKGCATYRPSPVRGAVLVSMDAPGLADAVAETKPSEVVELPLGATASNVVHLSMPVTRPEVLSAKVYKIKPGDHALYVTISDHDFAGRSRPFELFLSSKDVESMPWRTALSRMVSAVFRRDGDVSFVAEELKAIHDPRGGFWKDGAYVPSLPAAIGDVIERHLQELGGSVATSVQASARHCPKCQRGKIQRYDGCDQCSECSYTKCG